VKQITHIVGVKEVQGIKMEEGEKKNKKKTVWMAVIIVLLVLAVGYIVLDKYQERQQEEQIGIFQQGAQYGYEQAIFQIVEQAATCQEVPLRVGNETLGIVATACLQGTGGAN